MQNKNRSDTKMLEHVTEIDAHTYQLSMPKLLSDENEGNHDNLDLLGSVIACKLIVKVISFEGL